MIFGIDRYFTERELRRKLPLPSVVGKGMVLDMLDEQRVVQESAQVLLTLRDDILPYARYYWLLQDLSTTEAIDAHRSSERTVALLEQAKARYLQLQTGKQLQLRSGDLCLAVWNSTFRSCRGVGQNRVVDPALLSLVEVLPLYDEESQSLGDQMPGARQVDLIQITYPHGRLAPISTRVMQGGVIDNNVHALRLLRRLES